MQEAVGGDKLDATVLSTTFGTRGISQNSNSDMLGLEGPESYQPGYATSACLLCWRSQKLVTSLDLITRLCSRFDNGHPR